MRLVPGCLAAVAVVMSVAGCGKSTTVDVGGKKLTLMAPEDQELKRGAQNTVTITVRREGFTEVLQVKFADLPKGVTVAEDKPIDGNQTIGKYTLRSAADADLVDGHQAKVTLTGSGGVTITETFEITVKDKS